MASGIATFGNGAGGLRSRAGAQDAVRSGLSVQRGIRPAPLWIFVPPAVGLAAEEIMLIGSDYPVTPGETVYLAPWIDGRALKGCPMPPGTLVSMRFFAEDEDGPVAPGAGEFFRYTVTRDGVDTGCVIELTGAQTSGKSTVAVAFADQQKLNVRVDTSAGAGGARKANHNGSLRFAPDPDED